MLSLAAFAPVPAQAEVIEVAVDGSVRVRDGTGTAHGTGVDVATAPALAGPGTIALAVPELQPGSLTDLSTDLSPAGWRISLRAAALEAGLSPALLEAVVWQESRWNTRARSSAGAIGLGQLMPGTARQLGVDPHDPRANLRGAARYLRRQIDRFGGNLELALAAYNAGPERVAKLGAIPPFAETRAYVRAITARLAQNVQGDL